MREKQTGRLASFFDTLRDMVDSFGVSRLIVCLFFILLLFLTVPQELPGTVTNILSRVGMHGIMVLSMVPSIRAGLGPNFSVPFAILPGLLAGLIPVELNMSGMPAFLLALVLALAFSLPCGLLYGTLMNRVRKSEMMVATYFGYAVVAIMCIGWLILPFTNEAITWSMGAGLRNTINLESYFGGALSNILKIHVDFPAGDTMHIPVGFILLLLAVVIVVYAALLRNTRIDVDTMSEEEIASFKARKKKKRILGAGILLAAFAVCFLLCSFGKNLWLVRALTFSYTFKASTQMEIPTGILLFFALFCLIVFLFNRSKTGISMAAAGANPDCARASGIHVNRQRMLGAVMSTMLVAVSILVYAQQFGFLQLYNAPLTMCFPPIAAILIGGASIKEAKVTHAVIGVLLFQGILTMGPSVAERYLAGLGDGVDPTEIVRIIITNGIILYALAKAGGKNHAS